MRNKGIWKILAISVVLAIAASSVAVFSAANLGEGIGEKGIDEGGGEGVIPLVPPPFVGVASASENIDEDVDGWAKTYGSDKTNEGINSIQQTGDGYVVAGWVGESYFGNKDIWVAKLDSNGSIEWQKSYGGSESEEAYSIQSVNDGYIVAGYKSSGNNKDVWILKLDERGKIEWQKVFDWGDKDIAYSIKQTEDGGYIVIGETGFWRSEGKTESGIETRVLDSDVWILKLDKNGNIEWQKAYGGEYTDRAYSISEADHGYVFVRNMGDSVFCEVSKDGDILRQKAYVAWNYGDVVYSIQQTDDGYILAGWTNSYGAGKNDVWVINVNKFGSLKWQKSYGGSEDDKAYSILPTGDGYIFAGTTNSFGAGAHDAWVIKLDKDGNMQWQKSYGGSKDDEIRSVLSTEDGYIVTGYTGYFGSGNGDAWVLKLDKKGNINNCTMVKETNAVVTSTSAWLTPKSLTPKDTDTKGTITNTEAIDTDFRVQTICPYVKPVFPVYIIYVPDNYSTIQEAVDAASHGDTIIVRDGVYTENIDVDKSYLTIRSENGSDSTIVQAATSNSDVFKVSTNYVNINGFTVEGGNGSYMEEVEGELPFEVGRFHYCAGIYLKANYCNITNNNCSNNFFGIALYKSDDNSIMNNNCSNNGGETLGSGKMLTGTFKEGYGISLEDSNSNSITNNTCSSNHDYGIHLVSSGNNIIKNNNCSNNRDDGIHLSDSNNNKLTGNIMVKSGISIQGDPLSDYTHEIDMSNKVNGKPVYYWKDVEEGRFPDGAGQVILINCTNITIKNQNLNNVSIGIQIAFSSFITIKNNSCSNNDKGILLYSSSSNSISNNNCSDNRGVGKDLDGTEIKHGCGIYLRDSNSNNISNNNCSSNREYGIYLISSSNSIIKNNNVSNNGDVITSGFFVITLGKGIYLFKSLNNKIYLNDFINNSKDVHSFNSTNTWNSTSKITYTYKGTTYENYHLGNYWSDYTGIDADGDGIGDTPHSINSDSDHYPLIEPYENYHISTFSGDNAK